jgi:hypothetical protein
MRTVIRGSICVGVLAAVLVSANGIGAAPKEKKFSVWSAEDREALFTKLKGYLELAQKIVDLLADYPKKRDELRALRARPVPIDTGYRPDYYRSAAGLAELEQKAAVYDVTARRFVLDGVVLERGYVNPRTREITSFVDGMSDASVTTGRYLAACAYRYGTTGNAAHLQHLLEVLQGVYNLMTIASAPNGHIVHRLTQQRVTPRPGLPVRSFCNTASPRAGEAIQFSSVREDQYDYYGSLLGLPQGRYVFISDISRDQVDGLFLGLGATWEVLRKRQVAPEWQARIAGVVRATMRDFVGNGYRFLEFNGKPTRFGDQSQMLDPTQLTHNLSWLGTAVAITDDPELKGHYQKIANRYFGKNRLFKAGLYTQVLALLRPLLEKHQEVVMYTVSNFNFNLLAMSMYPLIRFAPDKNLREAYVDILEQLVWPLWKPRRIPFFDFIYLLATGKRDPELVNRAFGVLGQFRSDPFPFGNPASTTEPITDFRNRQELRDPLYDWLREKWDKDLAPHLPGQDNPFSTGGGSWPLGPGLIPGGDDISRSSPHYLMGVAPNYWWYNANWDPNAPLVQWSTHAFLLNYWFGRYFGLVAPGATLQIQLEPLKAQARTVFGRVVQKIISFVQGIFEHVKEFLNDAAMRLLTPDRKIREFVIPLARKLGTTLKAEMLARVQQFFAELGPSLRQLPVQTRHDVVDGAWKDLRGAIVAQAQWVRKKSLDRIDGWFSAKHRSQGIRAFTGSFDGLVAQMMGEVDTAYNIAMK